MPPDYCPLPPGTPPTPPLPSPEHILGLLKTLGYMIGKAAPIILQGTCIGYRVPVREFERVRRKAELMAKGEDSGNED